MTILERRNKMINKYVNGNEDDDDGNENRFIQISTMISLLELL